jgi:putative phosphoribosyl transferase
MMRFQNRKEAGKLLAERLVTYQNEKPLILAIPRGGVPVAKEVADNLKADLDILVVKKIGAPGNPEVAIGAVSEDGRPWFNSRVVSLIGMKMTELKAAAEEKELEVKAQLKKLRGSRKAIPIEGRNVIVIDDGIATGATLLAAIHLLKAQNPKKIIVAAPVAPASTLEEIERVADQVICLECPFPFFSVGDWYHDFKQVPDEEVLSILNRDKAGPEISP